MRAVLTLWPTSHRRLHEGRELGLELLLDRGLALTDLRLDALNVDL